MLKDELKKLKEIRNGLKDIVKVEYLTALDGVINALQRANLLEEVAAEKKDV